MLSLVFSPGEELCAVECWQTYPLLCVYMGKGQSEGCAWHLDHEVGRVVTVLRFIPQSEAGPQDSSASCTAELYPEVRKCLGATGAEPNQVPAQSFR